MKRIVVCFFLFLLGSYSQLAAQYNQIKLLKTKVSDKITVSIPETFSLMPDEAYVKKYGAYRKPITMYTSPDGKADFGINEAVNRSLLAYAGSEWKEEDIKMLKGVYKSSIAGMHSEVTFIQEDIQSINKLKFIVLEFIGTVKDEEPGLSSNRELQQYSYLQYTVEDAKILIFNFTCPAKFKAQWQNTVKEMMQSIKIDKP